MTFMLAMVTAHAEPDWKAQQAARTEARLADQPGGSLLMEAIDAHGGLEAWIGARTLAFDFDYRPLGEPESRRYTRSRVDLFGRRAVQVELGDGADATLGWDGTTAWITPDPGAFPSDARFWATTPFYFVGLPWVLADPGTRVDLLDPMSIPETGVADPLPTLKVTYEAGVGDAPDDYYVLHLHPESHRVVGVRYIVSFPGFFPDGGHAPEKLLLWSGHTEVDGLLFATHYDSYTWADGRPGAKKVEVDVANLAVGEPIPDADFSPPPHPVRGIDHLGLTVSDLTASRAFFEGVLGFRVRGEDKDYPAVFMTNGATSITLWAADDGAAPFDRKTQVGLHHLALAVSSFDELDRLHEAVRDHPGATVEFAPELSYGGPAKHMMFREPSGNRIELIHRP